MGWPPSPCFCDWSNLGLLVNTLELLRAYGRVYNATFRNSIIRECKAGYKCKNIHMTIKAVHRNANNHPNIVAQQV